MTRGLRDGVDFGTACEMADSRCVLTHAGAVDPVREFLRPARAVEVTMSFIPCIPCIPIDPDRASAEALLTFTTRVLPPGWLGRILAADDPFRAEAEAEAEAEFDAAVGLDRPVHGLDGVDGLDGLDGVDGVVGVNLSGGTAPGGEVAFADALALISEELTA